MPRAHYEGILSVTDGGPVYGCLAGNRKEMSRDLAALESHLVRAGYLDLGEVDARVAGRGRASLADMYPMSRASISQTPYNERPRPATRIGVTTKVTISLAP